MVYLSIVLEAVLLENEKHYPWLFLVPRRVNVSRMMDLEEKDQMQLMRELNVAQKILWDQFSPDQINVAAIGNKTSQLHIHVIGRFFKDPAWPQTVWDHPVKEPYGEEEKQSITTLLVKEFEKGGCFERR